MPRRRVVWLLSIGYRCHGRVEGLIDMPTYEVFLSEDGRESFRHVGALDAPDREMAVLYARETYIRRGEGSRAWVVARSDIVEVDPSDLAVTARRLQGRNDGKKIAERRQDRRAAADAQAQQ
jgi:phenylacetate-CoA oxygenase PaaH subunit